MSQVQVQDGAFRRSDLLNFLSKLWSYSIRRVGSDKNGYWEVKNVPLTVVKNGTKSGTRF